jgi:hypothetical protein
MKKLIADFSYVLEDLDLQQYAKLNTLEKLLWLESIFELTMKAETKQDLKLRQFFREDKSI